MATNNQSSTTRALIYRPLDVSRQEIRLIEFHDRSSSNGGVDSYSLVHASLQDQPTFSALSYVWGDPCITEDIIVDGVEFPVTVNLAAALKHAKTHWTRHHPDQDPASFRLWVDAICIDQDNVTERSQQVQNMAILYSSADLVIAWLGNSTAIIERAFETFELVWREVSELPKDAFCKLEWLEKYPMLYEDNIESSLPFNDDGWPATWQLFMLPYWKRVWIFQEAVLATTLLLCAGDLSLEYSKIEAVMSRLEDVKSSIHQGVVRRPHDYSTSVWEILKGYFSFWEPLHNIHGGRLMVKRRSKQLPSDRDTLWSYSVVGRGYLATDPKDHIYGLMAILDTGLIPDYSNNKSVAQVYRDYVEAWLNDYSTAWSIQPLHFLFCAGIGVFDNNLELPTWAPNYPEESKQESVGSPFKATANSGIFPPSSKLPSVENDLLVVDAIELDTICRAERAPGPDTWYDGSWLTYMIDFKNRHITYKTGIPPLQAALRALRFDTTTTVNAQLILFAYSMLDSLLMKTTGENIERAFEALGMGLNREKFNVGFPKCFFPEHSAAEYDWWAGWISWRSDGAREGSFEFFLDFVTLSKRWRFCETTSGYFGLAPLNTRQGDIICVLSGYSAPVVLRKENDQILFVGACFLVGLMSGEAKELMETRGLKVQTLKLS
jgi:hypothetical protein